MKVVYHSPGPLHLFFTTGINYFWELKNKGYHFVFIVPEYYRNSKEFQEIVKFQEVLDVLYIPAGGRIKLHSFCVREFANITKRITPDIILMHSCFFVDNLYLMNICRGLNARVFLYQSARYALDWKNEWWLIAQNRLRNAQAKGGIAANLPWLAKAAFSVSDWLAYVLDNMLLPLVFSKTVHMPSINVRNGTVISRKWLEKLGVTYFCYYAPEIKAMQDRLGPFPCIQIRHPATANVASVMSYLYERDGTHPADPSILVVPSWGNIDSLLLDGLSEADIIRKISDRWIEALELLLVRFPGRKVLYKLHPSSISDPVLAAITKAIKLHFGEALVVLQTGAPAERFAINADVVVSDVSSVLWWSGLVGKRHVISLDIFGYAHGGMMKDYPGLVAVVSDVREIASVEKAAMDEDHHIPGLAEVIDAW